MRTHKLNEGDILLILDKNEYLQISKLMEIHRLISGRVDKLENPDEQQKTIYNTRPMKAKNSYKRWTAEEDSKLENLKHLPLKKIAEAINRSESSVMWRLQRKNIGTQEYVHPFIKEHASRPYIKLKYKNDHGNSG